MEDRRNHLAVEVGVGEVHQMTALVVVEVVLHIQALAEVAGLSVHLCLVVEGRRGFSEEVEEVGR